MRTTTLTLTLALAAGSSLLAAGLIGAVQASEAGARRAARALAGTIRSELAQPGWIDGARAEQRFSLRDAALVAPPEVAWLEELPLAAPDGRAWAAEELMRRARRLEFEGDARAARHALDSAVEAAGQRRARWRALARRAWLAQRAGDGAQRDADLTALAAARAKLPLRVFASALELASVAHGELPAWSLPRGASLGPVLGAGVVARLGERGVETGALRAALAAAGRRRELLRRVVPHTAALAAATAAVVLPDSPNVVLYAPRGPGRGEGAVVPATEIAEHFAGSEFGTLVCGDALPATAEPVLAHCLGIVPARGGLGGLGLGGLLLGLGVCFSLGLVLAFRSLRRERDAMRARADFLTSVTHELRTPLASIRLLAEMLEGGRVPPGARQQRYFELLAGESLRLGGLIENVLDLGRIERGERGYDRRPLDPAGVAREVVALFAPLAQRDGVEVVARFEGPQASVRADRGALTQALLNVLDNARKYGGGGRRVELCGAAEGRCYRLCVRDHGPGVPVAEREVVFERFRRGAAQRNGSTPGVGLGLYLARSILRAHGGDLVLEASAGAGAQFAFTLPLREDGA